MNKGPLPLLFLLLLTMAGWQVPVPVLAAGSAVSIGTIDLGAILVLHPAMSSYDPYSQSFRKSGTTTLVNNEMERARESTGEVKKYQEQIRVLENQMHEMRLSQNREEAEAIARFDENIKQRASPTQNVHRSIHEKRMHELGQKFAARLRSVQAQIDQLQERSEQSNARGLSSRLTTPQETAQRFLAIYAEVQRVAQSVAAGKGIGIVLDSGNVSLRGSLSGNVGESLPGELDYSGIFTAAPPGEIARDRPSLQGHIDIQRSKAAIWYQNRQAILGQFRRYLTPSHVVVGGVDLTAEVLAGILNNYRINPNLQSVLLQIARSGQ
jgi:Skp family chaperone for outer membrane proteins